MPLTGHDSTIPALVIDTQAPLDVLYDAAAYRIRAVTQFWRVWHLGRRSAVMRLYCMILRCCWLYR